MIEDNIFVDREDMNHNGRPSYRSQSTKYALNSTSRADEGPESNSSETPIDIGQSHGEMGLAVREA